MKKIILLTNLFYSLTINAQLTKNYWLVGGDMNYEKYQSKIERNNNYSNFITNIKSGTFVIDKLVLGINLNLIAFSEKYTQPDGSISKRKQSNFSLGPFVRYYILNTEKTFNLFINSKLGFKKNKEIEFEQGIGIVYFLNSSTGIELSGGYNFISSNYTNQSYNRILLKLGIQFHLIKDE